MNQFNYKVNSLVNEVFAKIPQNQDQGEWSEHKDGNEQNVFFVKNIAGKDAVQPYTYHAKILDGTAHINFWMGEGQTQLTGQANAPAVLNAALYFIKKIQEMYDPPRISFHALKKTEKDEKESSSRGDVYLRLLQRFASQHGYDFERNQSTGQDTFTLHKKNDENEEEPPENEQMWKMVGTNTQFLLRLLRDFMRNNQPVPEVLVQHVSLYPGISFYAALEYLQQDLPVPSRILNRASLLPDTSLELGSTYLKKNMPVPPVLIQSVLDSGRSNYITGLFNQHVRHNIPVPINLKKGVQDILIKKKKET